MPTPEGGRGAPEHNPKPEQELPEWYRAARYRGEQPAGQTYARVEETLYTHPDYDLSAYRLILEEIYHVAVLGGIPKPEVQQTIEGMLYQMGTPTQLPEDILVFLTKRRAQAQQVGPWVEGHYRPGKRFKRKKR